MLLWSIWACGGVSPPRPVVADAPGGGLVVLIAVDQFPARMIDVVRPLLAPDGGFARLLGPDGFHATAAHTHAVTETCPGHATLVTGASPSKHGIVGNRWVDSTGGVIYCVDPDGDGAFDVGALRVAGVADMASAAGRRVVSLGLKDRAPVLMGGKSPTAVVWFDRKAFAFHGSAWSTVPLARTDPWTTLKFEGYAAYPDDQPFESDALGGRVFPHPPPADVNAWLSSPAAGDALTAVAIAAISAEHLGQGSGTDLLAIGYSQTDYVGHAWGAESWEYIDALLRLDRNLQALFAYLDAERAGRWTVVLSSDHGVTPASHAFVDPAPLIEAAGAAARAAGAPVGPLSFQPPNVGLPPGTDPAVRAAAARAVAVAFAGADGVSGAWAWKVDGPPDNLRSSLDAERSGDVYVLLDEDRQWGTGAEGGADHGSPWPADQQVPVLAWGRFVRPGAVEAIVDTRVVAATVAALLGVAPPPGAEFGPLAEALSNTPAP